ncbi:MAG: PD-(D/E)XK nuclease family protein [Chloroflexota bacterium]|nr:PD-(D/E)XK nuclease family protein [Chloroflexota bacterium]
MPTEFLLASVGAGKTEAVQSRIASLKARAPFAKVWCLLATERQIYAFRQRLMSRADIAPALFNVEFFTFYGLYHHLLESAGKPQRILDHAARYRLLRLIVNEMERAGELEVFGRIAHTPGFVRVLSRFIDELKQLLTEPMAFATAAANDYDREIGRIYDRYHYLLQQYDLVDTEGEGWVAREELENYRRLARDVDLLVVDGYDQFNPLQADLLTQLAARVGETLVTLTGVPGRETTIGKRFQRALDRLVKYHQEEPVVYRIVRPPILTTTRHPALEHLIVHIFAAHPVPWAALSVNPSSERRILRGEGLQDESSPVKFSVSPSPLAERGLGGEVSPLALLEAPDAAAEVATALRRAKALLLGGARPDDVLVAVRDWARYGRYFEAQARAYGVPLAVDAGEALAENPAVYALLRLLDLHKGDFRRRDLLDVLRAAYFIIPGISTAEVDTLERLSREHLVTGGRKAWLTALDAAMQPPVPDEDGELPDTHEDSAHLTALRAALEAFFDAITPPAGKLTADYAAWLEDLIGDDPTIAADEGAQREEYRLQNDITFSNLHLVPTPEPSSLKVIAQCRLDAGEGVVARDLAALEALKRVLRGMLSAQRLFGALELEATIGWDAFYADLTNAIKGATVGRSSGRDGRVLVTTVTEARGLPHRHVIVLGLSEGIFPMRASEEPLYLDSERRRLQKYGIPLPTQAERADDDGLFYEMISMATDTLTLTRMTVENGAELPPSHLWREVRKVFPYVQPEALRIGAVVPAQSAAAAREVALACAAQAGDATLSSAQAWYAQAYADRWAHMQHARAVELRRMSRAAHDRYSGRLQDAEVMAVAGAAFSGRVWSASQLNDYGMCGFRFFARRLLKLEPLEEPEEGMDAAQLGSVYHDILEKTYAQLIRDGVSITPDHLDAALAVLERVAAERLPDAPQRFRFPVPPQWASEQQVILRKLRALVRDDFNLDSDFNKKLAKLHEGERRPHQVEAPFGNGGIFTLDLDDMRLRVRGKIDRIDTIDGRALVIDYKTGSTGIPTSEIARGRNFQMMIYVLATQGMADVAGGAFWHIGSRSVSGLLTPDDEAISDGRHKLTLYMERGQAGDFTSEANKVEDAKCSRYCEYSQMCRFSVMGRRKETG